MLFKTKEEYVSEIQKLMSDINEVLAKSEYAPMKKDDEQEEMPQAEASPAPAQEEPQMEAPAAEQAPEAQPEMEAPEAEAAPSEEAPAEEQSAEAQSEEEQDELQETLSSMSDEELEMMHDMLMAEMSERGMEKSMYMAKSENLAKSEEEKEDKKEEKSEEKSEEKEEEKKEDKKEEKEEEEKLAKSFQELISQVETLTKQVEDLSKPQPKKAVVTKPLQTNNIQVLEKSAEPAKKAERLTKSETIEFLQNKIRGGARIDMRHMTDLVHCKSQEEVNALQDRLSASGIVEFPKK